MSTMLFQSLKEDAHISSENDDDDGDNAGGEIGDEDDTTFVLRIISNMADDNIYDLRKEPALTARPTYVY